MLTGLLKKIHLEMYSTYMDFTKTVSVEQKTHNNLRWNDLNSVAWGLNDCKQLMLFISLLHSLNWFLLFTGCQKGHRAGGSHGETENEGWSEAGEQYIVRNSIHIVKSVTWRTVFSRPQRPNMWQQLDYLTINTAWGSLRYYYLMLNPSFLSAIWDFNITRCRAI